MALGQAFYFLITTIFSFLTYALVFRFLFTLLSRNYRNDLNSMLSKISEPMVRPFRTFLPIVNKRVDIALLLVIYLLHLAEFALLVMLFSLGPVSLVSIMIRVIFTILLQMMNIISFSIVILVILSWVNPAARNPLTDALFYLSDWLLAGIRRYLPPMAGIDLSPMIAILGIQFINIAFIRPFAL